ncbi:MAG: GNAT family N-acetyltransferase [Tepidiformaceae bacterium]
MTVAATSSTAIEGFGLELRPWDAGLVRQMAAWGERGFPFHAFDLGHLRDAAKAEAAIHFAQQQGPHQHWIACENGFAVGRVSVNLQDVSGLYIWAVHVPPEQGGRGVCRRMLAALMTHLEATRPNAPEFVLSSNTFAEPAHRAYRALGFEVAETRWHFDKEIAERLWKVEPAQREPIARHIRFQSGRWQVRTYIFKRRRGAPMLVGSPPPQ